MQPIAIATRTRLVALTPDGEPRERWSGKLRAAAPAGDRWFVADEEGRVRVIEPDGAVAWTATVPGPTVTALAPLGDGLLAGTDGAHLHHVTGEGAVPVASFDDAPGRGDWYTPWGGPPAVRTIAVRGDDWFVNVHVGGIVRSRDAGATWEPTLDIDLDIHEIVADEGSGLLLAVAGAGGLLVSEDGGDTWHHRTEGLHATYCRAVAAAGDTVLVSAARGPSGGDAAVYRGRLGTDGPLERCRSGLPADLGGNVDTGWLDAAGPHAALATQDGAVYVSEDAGETWSEAAGGLDRPVRVAVGT